MRIGPWFLCGRKWTIHVQKVLDGFKNIRIREDGVSDQSKKNKNKCTPDSYAAMFLLKIGRATCQGHFSIE